jgi:beta-galactosidase/beta-glucuronidase
MLMPAAAQAAPKSPAAVPLSKGWQSRGQAAAPGKTQPPPPQEGGTGGQAPGPPAGGQAGTPPQTFSWSPTAIPSVFDPNVKADEYPGEVRRYRLRFRGPATPKGYHWLLSFEEVRRAASVYLNGHHLGTNHDPYTPFAFEAKGLKPRKTNELVVVVDDRKDPRLPEGWWNWGGIVRPVKLVPVGPAYLDDLGAMSKVSCRGPATGCRASLLLDGWMQRRSKGPIKPILDVRLRAPGGRVTTHRFALRRQKGASHRYTLTMKVPAPQLWSPDNPQLYSARFTVRQGNQVLQVQNKRLGLRSVKVKGGLLYLNNRRIQLRGASVHEDMPGHGAALTNADMDEIVAELKELGANVTRAHYLLNDRLLSKFDRAGIMVWNEAPVWQRDRLLSYRSQRARAEKTVKRTVIAARSHPSVLTHSVANELTFTPDNKPTTHRYLVAAAHIARDFDPTVPISVDLAGKINVPYQSVYGNFDMLGLNNYFGWYGGNGGFNLLVPYLDQMRSNYPNQAFVMTEFGAEGRPELADAPPDKMGGYAFQAMHAGRTLDVVDRTHFMSGAIYWTLREFEIFPGWTGGAGPRPPQYTPNTRHQKGLITYEGQKKPVWQVVHDHYARVPLYAP